MGGRHILRSTPRRDHNRRVPHFIACRCFLRDEWVNGQVVADDRQEWAPFRCGLCFPRGDGVVLAFSANRKLETVFPRRGGLTYNFRSARIEESLGWSLFPAVFPYRNVGLWRSWERASMAWK